MIKKVYGFCVCTGDNPHLSFQATLTAHLKFFPIKSHASLVPPCTNIILFMHYLSHIPRGKGACDLGEGVLSSTLSTKVWLGPLPRIPTKISGSALDSF